MAEGNIFEELGKRPANTAKKIPKDSPLFNQTATFKSGLLWEIKELVNKHNKQIALPHCVPSQEGARDTKSEFFQKIFLEVLVKNGVPERNALQIIRKWY